MIRKGDRITIKPKYQDPGDTEFVWYACDDEEKGRVTITPLGTTLTLAPRQTVRVGILEKGNAWTQEKR